MNKIVQSEFDKFEEYILMRLFEDINNLKCSKKIQLFLISKNMKLETFINEKIQLFECFMSDFMTSTGIVDGNKLTEYMNTKYPALKGCIISIKLSQYAQILDNILGFEAIGSIIQNL